MLSVQVRCGDKAQVILPLKLNAARYISLRAAPFKNTHHANIFNIRVHKAAFPEPRGDGV
jgi:hypothetical protein